MSFALSETLKTSRHTCSHSVSVLLGGSPTLSRNGNTYVFKAVQSFNSKSRRVTVK